MNNIMTIEESSKELTDKIKNKKSRAVIANKAKI